MQSRIAVKHLLDTDGDIHTQHSQQSEPGRVLYHNNNLLLNHWPLPTDPLLRHNASLFTGAA